MEILLLWSSLEGEEIDKATLCTFVFLALPCYQCFVCELIYMLCSGELICVVFTGGDRQGVWEETGDCEAEEEENYHA